MKILFCYHHFALLEVRRTSVAALLSDSLFMLGGIIIHLLLPRDR